MNQPSNLQERAVPLQKAGGGMYLIDMIHHNPGEAPMDSAFRDPLPGWAWPGHPPPPGLAGSLDDWKQFLQTKVHDDV